MWQEGTGVERGVRRSDRRRPPIEGHEGTRAVLVRVARRRRWRGTRRGGPPAVVVACGQEVHLVVAIPPLLSDVGAPGDRMPRDPEHVPVAVPVDEILDGQAAVERTGGRRTSIGA